MNLKRTPKPWQIFIEIAALSALTCVLLLFGSNVWHVIGGGFKSLAVILLIVIILAALVICFDNVARRRHWMSHVYLDVFKGCWGTILLLFIIGTIDYSIGQFRYLKKFKERKARETEVIRVPSLESDSILIENQTFQDYYSGPYSLAPTWGRYDSEKGEYNWIDMSDYPSEACQMIEGSLHICVSVPDDYLILEWTSKRLKKYLDWATGMDIPYCPILNTGEQLCLYYYGATGGNKFTVSPVLSEDIKQYAIFLGSAMNIERYFTIEQDTWYEDGSCGNSNRRSWFTVDRETGKELSIYDIIDEKYRQQFDSLMLKHLCNSEGYWKDNHSFDEAVICGSFNGVALVPEGVVVYYYPYEIGSGAEGQFHSLIPYEELCGILKIEIN